MVWDQKVSVIVMLTTLADMGLVGVCSSNASVFHRKRKRGGVVVHKFVCHQIVGGGRQTMLIEVSWKACVSSFTRIGTW